MNRIVIIGNGFDLSHNLKTSYKDFLTYYLKAAIDSFQSNGSFISPLLQLGFKHHRIIKFESSILDNPFLALESFRNYPQIQSEYSDLLRHSISEIEIKKWVDVERLYFELLLKSKRNGTYNEKTLEGLNAQFEELKNALIDYLEQLQTESSIQPNQEYLDLFISHSQVQQKKKPSKLVFLNFNYTNTLNHYVPLCSRHLQTSLIHIHGTLGNKENPIIFGYGDDKHKEYEEILEANIAPLMKHFKAFAYLKTANYRNIMDIINSDKFEVHVYGHSLGLSDRMILKEIFQNPNLLEVRLFFYHGPNGSDFNEKTNNLVRHFASSADMLRVVIPESESKPMPKT